MDGPHGAPGGARGTLAVVVQELSLAGLAAVVGMAAVVLLNPATGAAAQQVAGFVQGPALHLIAAGLYLWAAPKSTDFTPPDDAQLAWGKSMGWVATLWAAALLGSAALAWIMTQLGAPPQEQEAVRELFAAGELGPLIVLGGAAVVLAPVTEELFHRVGLWRRLRARAGTAWAYGVGAVVFAVIHQNPAGIPTYAWLAVTFALALHKTGRPSCAIAVHMLNNATVFGLLWLGVI